MKMHWIKVAITLSWKIRYHQHRSIMTTKIWLNPPYNQSVSTYPAQTLLKLIDRHFPRLSRFYKIFNRNTIKVSYSCTDNIEQHVKKHNNYAQQKRKVTYNLVITAVTNLNVLSMVNAEQKTSYINILR